MVNVIKIINILGFFIAIICFFNNFIKMLKNDEVEYQTVSILAFIDSIMYISSNILFESNNDKMTFVMAIMFSLTGCILLIDDIFFAEKRVRKNYDVYYATTLLEEAGISYHTFKKLSYDEQLQLLKTTPCKFENMEGMLIEDEDDLKIFACIMNKKKNW